jgi:hypothetical protein
MAETIWTYTGIQARNLFDKYQDKRKKLKTQYYVSTLYHIVATLVGLVLSEYDPQPHPPGAKLYLVIMAVHWVLCSIMVWGLGDVREFYQVCIALSLLSNGASLGWTTTWFHFVVSSATLSRIEVASFTLYVLAQCACVWCIVTMCRLLKALEWKEAQLVGMGAIRIKGVIDARRPYTMGDLLGDLLGDDDEP